MQSIIITNREYFIKTVVLIQLLIQISRDITQELEEELRKGGEYRLGIKQDIERLNKMSLQVRRDFYKVLTEEEVEHFCQDLDQLEYELKRVAKEYVKN